MKGRFLSLAMNETIPGTGQFTVIAAVENKPTLVTLHLCTDDIIGNKGKVNWDIGKITAAETTPYTPPNTSPFNSGFKAINPRMEDNNDLEHLKERLADLAESFLTFKSNKQIRLAVVKVKKVTNLIYRRDEKNKPLKCYMEVELSTSPGSTIQLLNKDYRWITYWNHLNEDSVEENKLRYLSLLNRSDKSLYFVLYKHFFKNDSKYWIAGMHWL